MSLILGLGTYISVPLISEWLILEDLVTFDSALCVLDRVSLTTLFQNFSNVFERFFSNASFPLSVALVYWLECRNISITCFNWELSDLVLTEWHLMPARFTELLKKAHKVKSVQVANVRTHHALCAALLKAMVTLQSFDFTLSDKSNALLGAVSSSHLTKIKLASLSGVTKKLLQSLLVKQKKLLNVTLDLDCVTVDIILKLPCPLTTLEVGGASGISADHLAQFCTNKLETISSGHLGDKFVQSLANFSGQSLTTLPIDNSFSLVTAEGSRRLFESCHSLTEVNLYNWPQVDEETILVLLAGNTRLKRIRFAFYENDMNARIVAHCGHLQEMQFVSFIHMNEHVIETIAVNCPMLCALHLGTLESSDRMEAALSTLMNACRSLKNLRVATSCSLAGLHERGHQLTALHIDSSDSELIRLFPHCPNITNLSLLMIHGRITQTSVLAAVRSCNLKKLSCAARIDLSSEAIDEMIATLSGSLCVLHAPHLTTSAEERERLVSGLRKLKCATIYGLPGNRRTSKHFRVDRHYMRELSERFGSL